MVMKNKGLIISGLIVVGVISFLYVKKRNVTTTIEPIIDLTDFSEKDEEDKKYPHAMMKSDYDKLKKKQEELKKKQAYQKKLKAYNQKLKAYRIKKALYEKKKQNK